MKKKWMNNDRGRIAGFKGEILEVFMKWNLSLWSKNGSLVIEQYDNRHVEQFRQESNR